MRGYNRDETRTKRGKASEARVQTNGVYTWTRPRTCTSKIFKKKKKGEKD